MIPQPDNERVIADLAGEIRSRAAGVKPLIVGLTGSVAAGKSTLCQHLAEVLRAEMTVEALGTDGFLLPNQVLDRLGLSMRKGFPESYDMAALRAAIKNARAAPTAFPGYSHVTYDVDEGLARVVDRPDVLILEGLAFSPADNGEAVADLVDVLIYLDADEQDLEAWFVDRFMRFWRAAETDSASFYSQFRHMSSEEADQFARLVWGAINLPNLRQHIIQCRDRAQLLLHKSQGHRLSLVRR